MFSFLSPALPSWASTLLRDSWQEDEGLGPNTRWPGPGELNSLLTVLHSSLERTHFFLILTLSYCIGVPYSHANVICALKTHRLSWWVCVFTRNSPWLHAILFSFLLLFATLSCTFQACSFSLVGWLKKHERFIGSSIKRDPEWKRRCFLRAPALLGNEKCWKNNCIFHVLGTEHSLWTTVNLRKAT